MGAGAAGSGAVMENCLTKKEYVPIKPRALLPACAPAPIRVPVAVACSEMAPDSAWMMEPAKNAFLTKRSLKTPPTTPQKSQPGSSGASGTSAR
jgi:hypothetical protein